MFVDRSLARFAEMDTLAKGGHMARRYEISAHEEGLWDNQTDRPITLRAFIDMLCAGGYSDDEIMKVLDAMGKYRNEHAGEPSHAGVTLVIEEPGRTHGAD